MAEGCIVEFRDVGRDKRSWSARLKRLTHEELRRQAKGRGGLMSKDIHFQMDEDGNGNVLVGGWRIVGTFKVITNPLAEMAR